ncbi:hypothetical protein TL16_g11087 [Triparma laevis f. inornata]|uniref:Uncharacterized protein n=1 Tax=Triparma laevis f. inornata TaxID=1714386 RepID=A0A9W7BCR8_9STRA|nr:hypothetical protein TL16_g11087 [Triparma laevis f. inornata]
MYDWASSVFTNSILLIPLLITDLAKQQSQGSDWSSHYNCEATIECEANDMQFSEVCESASNKCLFNSSGCFFKEDTCVPATSNKCCVKDPSSLTVNFLGGDVNYASVFAYLVSISVGLQVIAFIVLAPIADYGRHSKFMLKICTALGSMCLFLVCFCDNVPWELPGALFVVGNVAFGMCTVFYNGYLPKITTPDSYDRVGTKGVALGYIGGQVCLFLMFGPLLGIAENEHCLLGLSIGVGLTGLWWAAFGAWSLKDLPDVEGEKWPEGESMLTFGPKEVWKTTTHIRNDLPETGKFLLAYFVFSDGNSTIVDTVLVFASEELAIGAFAGERVVRSGMMSTKGMVMLNIAVIALLPMLGHPDIPIFSSEHLWTFFLASVVFGLCNGSMTALTRSLYTRFIPKGREHEFFGFYEVTDKGTSWLGPLIVGIVVNITGSLRQGFFSVFFFMVIGGLLLWRVDVEKGAKAVGRVVEERDEEEKG